MPSVAKQVKPQVRRTRVRVELRQEQAAMPQARRQLTLVLWWVRVRGLVQWMMRRMKMLARQQTNLACYWWLLVERMQRQFCQIEIQQPEL